MAIVVISARGGSKGIPGKNMLSIGGKPLIFYSIMVAKECEVVSDVVVSSDDEEILEYSESFGAIPIRRPDVLATDGAPTEPSIRHIINELGIDDTVVLLQPTSPLRTPTMLRRAIDKYNSILTTGTVVENGVGYMNVTNHSIFTAHEERYYHWTGVGSSYSIDGYNYMAPRLPKQHVGDEIRENGSIYITSSTNWIYYNRFALTPIPLIIPPICGMELDYPWQIPIMEYILDSKIYVKELEKYGM